MYPLSSRNDDFSSAQKQMARPAAPALLIDSPPSPFHRRWGRSAHPAAAEVAQRVGTPFAKIVENSCSATWSRGAPGPTEHGQTAGQSSRHTSKLPTCPVVIMTRITRRHDSAVLIDGLSAHLSGWLTVTLSLFVLAFIHPERLIWVQRGRQEGVNLPGQIQHRAVAAPTYPRCR